MVVKLQIRQCRIYWIEFQISVDWDMNAAHKESGDFITN